VVGRTVKQSTAATAPSIETAVALAAMNFADIMKGTSKVVPS
jgi:hypothetical protein